MKVKTKEPELKKKEVVCKIPCRDCDAAYIGETGRPLQKRIAEHKYGVKTNNRKNGIAVHAWDNDHRMQLGCCRNYGEGTSILRRVLQKTGRMRKQYVPGPFSSSSKGLGTRLVASLS